MSVHVGETIKHEIHINIPSENLIWGTIALARSKLVFFLIFMRLPLLTLLPLSLSSFHARRGLRQNNARANIDRLMRLLPNEQPAQLNGS